VPKRARSVSSVPRFLLIRDNGTLTFRVAALCLMALSFLAPGAAAQVVWALAVFSPDAPTNLEVVRATFLVPAGCGVESATVVEGLTIRTTVTLSDCPAGPPLLPVSRFVDFGPLPAGSYLYEIVFESDDSPPEIRSQQTLTVWPFFGPLPVFDPAAPTSADAIRARISVPGGCGVDDLTVVDGTTVRTTLRLFGCGTGPPPITSWHDVVFGPLPANHYLYEVVWNAEFDPPALVSRQALVVAAALPQAPALSPAALLVLMFALAMVAVCVMRGAVS
jgi:hypothetical protein